jgi:hypothetical protein
LTVQIGEFGRLPFDVNVIRTVQFSRSESGLIRARDELIQILSAGLAGEYDSVTATRIWWKGTLRRSLPSPTAAARTGTDGSPTAAAMTTTVPSNRSHQRAKASTSSMS